MGKQTQRERIGELVSKCRELGLTYKEGAERFGVGVWRLYEYNKRQKETLNAGSPVVGSSSAAGEGSAKESAGMAVTGEASRE